VPLAFCFAPKALIFVVFNDRKMMKRFDFVIYSQQSWDTKIGSNAKDIAMTLARENRVLYVNRPLDWQTILKKDPQDEELITRRLNKRKQSVGDRIEEVQPNLFAFTPKSWLLSINGLPDGKAYDWANKYNNSILAKEINHAIAYLDFQNHIFINDGEMFSGFYLNDMIGAEKSLYYYRDYFLAVPYWQKHGNRLEPQLFNRYDAVICNSEYLTGVAAKHNKQSHYVGQGCDFSLLETKGNAPVNIENNGKPVVGYVGALNSQRLDLELLEQLAAEKTEWHWVFVGPEDEAFKQSRLHELENVQFTGPQPQSSLAAFINQFDVAMNPQRFNPVTIGNYPRKIDEYLYLGKPTVATKTEAMEMFSAHCYLATGKDEYVSAIQRALNENTKEAAHARSQFATEHSWPNSIDKMYNVINQL
jgi:teichuronic acid biosynthesis glycosyltransferase TuaH